MKNILYMLLMIFFAISFYSCKDDDNQNGQDNLDREYMAMFRRENNTGISAGSDPYECKVINTNDIQLYWYGVNGAAGYRIRMKSLGQSWEGAVLKDTIVGPEVLSLKIEDLQYSTGFMFAIQTLSKRGEQYNSKWYGYGDTGHANDYMTLVTNERYSGVPDVLWVENVTKTSLRVCFNLNYDESANPIFEHENGKFLMDEIKVEPSATNPDLSPLVFKLTEEDKERGYIEVTGLAENAVYNINGFNNHIKRYWDRLYNSYIVRMKGELGEPITIKHICDPLDVNTAAQKYNASRIDTILEQYMSDNSLAEGTVFVLESGKNYYMQSTINMSKGFMLKSADPNNPATVLMGIGLRDDGTPNSSNFSFGRGPAVGEIGGISVQSIVFEGIKFDAPEAYTYGNKPSGSTGLGNYFINQSSNAMAFTLESFEIRNCEFQGMIRGWVRVQGSNRKLIQKFLVENSLFYNCGYYDNNGRGYAWVNDGGENVNSNIFMNMQFRNNTFIDSPRDHFFTNSVNKAWSSTWNITMENNTFINFSTRSSGRLIFNLRYLPINSSITFKKNLFIQTRAEGDDRELNLSGMDIRNTPINYDIAENYSTNMNKDGKLITSGEIFTTGAFSATKNSAGVGGGTMNLQGKEELPVHLGKNPIPPTELMVNPNSKYKNGDPNMHKTESLDGFYYKNTDAVRNHEIYKLGIGDPRWRKNVTP